MVVVLEQLGHNHRRHTIEALLAHNRCLFKQWFRWMVNGEVIVRAGLLTRLKYDSISSVAFLFSFPFLIVYLLFSRLLYLFTLTFSFLIFLDRFLFCIYLFCCSFISSLAFNLKRLKRFSLVLFSLKVLKNGTRFNINRHHFLFSNGKLN